MSEMKLIMENFRRFSEQVCTGGACEREVPKTSSNELEGYLNQLNKQYLEAKKSNDKDAMEALGFEINRIKKEIGTPPVKEQAGETGPDPLGLRNFGNIAEIPGYLSYEGEGMEDNQKIYRHRFDNLKSALKGKEYTEMAATRSTGNKKMLASKKISLVSAEIVERPDLAGFGQAQNQPRELKVTWNVGRASRAKPPESMPVAPGLPPQR